jgi:hypothetical protein
MSSFAGQCSRCRRTYDVIDPGPGYESTTLSCFCASKVDADGNSTGDVVTRFWRKGDGWVAAPCGCTPPCMWPPCVDCEDDHASSPGNRCRDCDLQYLMHRMECSGCNRMRYRTNVIGAIWGDPCKCDPKPPSRYELGDR